MVLSLSVTPCLSLSLSLSLTSLSQCLRPTPLPALMSPTQAPSRWSTSLTHASAQSSISTLTQCRLDHCFGFSLIRPIRLRPTFLPSIRPTLTLSSSPKPSSVIGDFFYFVWSGLRKKIGDFFFFFFFLLLWTGGGGGGGGGGCGCGWW